MHCVIDCSRSSTNDTLVRCVVELLGWLSLNQFVVIIVVMFDSIMERQCDGGRS